MNYIINDDECKYVNIYYINRSLGGSLYGLETGYGYGDGKGSGYIYGSGYGSICDYIYGYEYKDGPGYVNEVGICGIGSGTSPGSGSDYSCGDRY